jgi:hypothetical protein
MSTAIKSRFSSDSSSSLRERGRLGWNAEVWRRRGLGFGAASDKTMRMIGLMTFWNIGGLPLEGELGGLERGPNADH